MDDSESFITEEEASTPKKSFWAHLNDLRTALVRSVIAIGIALVVCLLMADKLIWILEYPLSRIDMFEKPKPTVSFMIGSTRLGPYVVTPEQFPGIKPDEAPQLVFQLGAAQVGKEQVATLKLLPPDPSNTPTLKIRLHNFGPAEAFFIAFHVGIYGALVLSAPFWAFFLGQFFLPALNIKERTLFFRWVGWSVALFFAGVLLTYFGLLPLALRASSRYFGRRKLPTWSARNGGVVRAVIVCLLEVVVILPRVAARVRGPAPAAATWRASSRAGTGRERPVPRA